MSPPLFYMGELAAACEHLHAAIALYDANPQGPLPMVFSQDQKATAQAYVALAEDRWHGSGTREGSAHCEWMRFY